MEKTIEYESYADVPWFRQQWFFWISWFVVQPVAIYLLLTGDIYYVKKAEVRAFGPANRIVAGVAAVFMGIRVIGWLAG